MTDQTVAARWNEIALEAVRLGDAKPTEITRALHIAHAAMYDAWAAYDDAAAGAYSEFEITGPTGHLAQATAVSFAAHAALREVFPDHKFLFDSLLAELTAEAEAHGRTPPESAALIGQAAARAVLEARATDGSNAENDYADTSGYEPVNPDSGEPIIDPNHWTPLRVPNGTVRDENGIPIATDNPATYDLQKPLSPHWGDVTPFAIEDGDAYRPDAPPKLGDFTEYVDQTGKVTTGDAAYREQFGALVEISANLTAEQKATAEYWADGPQSSTPPGHWNEIAQDVSVREGHDLGQDVKFFFALNNALFDTGIAIWDAKYAYDYVRPQTAIRYLFEGQDITSWIGPDQGAGLIDGGDWIPYQDVTFVTPPFPEYGSGHSGFSYAAASIIAAFTGTDVLYDGVSRGVKDLDGDGLADLIGSHVTDSLTFESYDGAPIELSWGTVWDAAADAGLSRLYGGIHIQDGDLSARRVGAEVAEDVWTATSRLFTQDADEEIRPDGRTSGTLDLGEGGDVLVGDLDALDGLRVSRFTGDDAIRIEGLSLGDDNLAVKRGSAILEIDANGDGIPDGVITLEGDFDGQGFRMVSFGGETVLTLAGGADIQLTSASERFHTADVSDNVIATGAGDDDVRAGAGNDVVDGDAGNDVLRGEAGDDTMIGGLGDDTLSGGAGRDVFAISASAFGDRDVIADYTRGEDRIELAGFGTRLGPDDVQLSRVDGDLLVTFATGQSVQLVGVSSLAQLSLADLDLVTDGRNVDFSGLVPQTLSESDDDFVSDGGFSDAVFGLGGNDSIVTGDGNDTITGGAGSDTMDGGAGADLFRITGADLGTGSVDVIRGFQSGLDQVQFIGIPGVAGLGDLRLTRVDGDLAVDLGGGNLLQLAGITRLSQLNPVDAIIGGNAPEMSVGLSNDTGASDSDAITRDASVSGQVSDDVGIAALEVRVVGGRFIDITGLIRPDGSFDIPSSAVRDALGEGSHNIEFRVTDQEGKTTSTLLAFTLDRQGPAITGDLADGLSETLNSLTLTLSEPFGGTVPNPADFDLRDADGNRIEITSVDRRGTTEIELNLGRDLADGLHSLNAMLTDLAGNIADIDTDFTVAAVTRVLAIRPTDGAERANLDGKITIEFNRPIDPDTVDATAIKITALGAALEGRFTLSSDGTLVTFFADDLLPAATGVRVEVDGEKLRAADGSPVGTEDEGTVTFSTASLTRVENTNVEGFIFDANYRDEDGLDIPLAGVVVSVIGLPGVTAVTDANGRFLLEDLPIPQVYLDFDASGVTNRPNFDYGTITKPVDTVAGQTVGLSSGDKAFNIYFAALAEADTTTLTPGQETEAGIGENGLENLAEIFPGIDPALWTQLKVKIPADSLTRDDGTPVDEVQVMAFEPDRIPAPLPPGFDPTVVFTVKAGDATNVDGKAQIEFPNIDGLELGAKRPILSFDHDAGVWVQTGTAVVVEDGNGGTILVSEGDTGVNTLGWKAVGDDPTVPLDDDPKTHDDLGIGNRAFESFRQNVSSQLASASAAVGIVDTVTSAIDVVVPDGPVSLVIDAPLTAIGGGLGVAADLVGTGEVGAETIAGIGLGLTADGLSSLEVPGEIAALAPSTASTLLGIKGAMDAAERANAANRDLGNALVEWAEMFGNDVGQFLDDVGQRAQDTVDGIRDYVGDRIQQARNAVDTLERGIDAVGNVLNAFDRLGDLFRNPVPRLFLNPQPAGDGNLSPEFQEVLDAINLALDSLAALEELSAQYGALTFEQIFDVARSDLVQSSEEFEEATNLALEGASRIFYAIELANGVVLRGVTDDGSVNLQLPSDETVTISYFAPDTGFVRQFTINTNDLGPNSNLQSAIFDRDPIDVDGDNLGAVAEFVLGTDPDNRDTDGDGVTDGAEVEQGLNPLDGVAFPTGIIGTVALKGEALDVTLTGGTGGAGGQTAYLATGSHGLAIIDASQFQNPILQAELDLAGTAKQVAVDAGRALAFVAAGEGGLHIVDVSDPLVPVLQSTTAIPGGAQSIVDLGGTLLVGGGSRLTLLNASTGAKIADFESGGYVNDLAVDGDTAYAIVNNTELVSFQIAGSTLVELGRETFPQSTIRTVPKDKTVFINEGVAYVANALEVSNVPLFRLEERGGYLTFDVTDPANIALISNIDTPRVQAGNLETIVNGSGLALVAGGFRGLQVHNAADPDLTYDLLAEFATPGEARGVALASGIAYVADGTGGLQVINVLPFDADGQAPEITFDAQAADADPDAAGIQIEEGARIGLSLDITDDVQVRNVELLLNGAVVLNDVSAPFALSFDVPALDSLTSDQLEIRIRATDTGGNSTLTDPINVQVIEDITPPTILSVTPGDGRLLLQGNEVFTIAFSEKMDPASVSLDDITLTRVSDGAVIPALGLVFLAGGQSAQISFAPLDLGAYEIAVDLAGASDLAGNAFGMALPSQTFEIVDATAVWTDPAGGNWLTAENWQTGLLPEAGDGVAIVLDEGAVVTLNSFSSDAIEVDKIRLDGILRLQNGTLQANLLEGSGGRFEQSGGTLLNTVITGGPDFAVRPGTGAGYYGYATWQGVQLDTDATVQLGSLSVRSDLTLNGTLTLDDTPASGSSYGSARLNLRDVGTISGTGTIRLDGDGTFLRTVGSYSSNATIPTILDEGIDLIGAGYVSGSSYAGQLRILGQVTAEGGTLRLTGIDQSGDQLQLDTIGDAVVRLGSNVENARLVIADGANVHLTAGQNLEVEGPGVLSLIQGQVDNLDVRTGATLRVEDVDNFGTSATIRDALNIDGRLDVVGTAGYSARLTLRDMSEVTGGGILSLGAVAQASDARLTLTGGGYYGSANRVFTLGEDLTLTGAGRVYAGYSGGAIRILGDVIGQAGSGGATLDLERVNQGGAELNIDTSAGAVHLRNSFENGILTGTGAVDLLSGLTLRDVTIAGAAQVGPANGYSSRIYSWGGLDVDGTLDIDSGAAGYSRLLLRGAQEVGGTGRITLSGDAGTSRMQINGISEVRETVTFGAGLTLAGNGVLTANSREDSLRILGEVEGVAGGRLRLTDIDNAGAELSVDASQGSVAVEGVVQNAVFTAAAGSSGSLDLLAGAVLDQVTLDMDTRFEGSSTSQRVEVTGGLTVNDVLTLVAGASQTVELRTIGSQLLDGTGTIRLTNAPAPAGSFQESRILLSNAHNVIETLTIGADLTVEGVGVVEASSAADRIAVDGTLRADDGTLEVEQLTQVEGRLEATDDGTLSILGPLSLSERATLSFGLGAAGQGLMSVGNAVTLDGTLALDVDAGFAATAGDTFTLLTAGSPITGAFDAFTGFDLAGNLAFELLSTANALTLRVTDDATAEAGGFINGGPFTPAPRPVDPRSPITTDLLDDAAYVRLTGPATAGQVPQIANNADLVDVVLATDVQGRDGFGNHTINIYDALTLAGDASVTFTAQDAGLTTLNMRGGSDIAGTGTLDFMLSPVSSDQDRISFIGQLAAPETFEIGAGITVTGSVDIDVSSHEDRVRILGDLVGRDGETLSVRRLDNGGATLNVDARAGIVELDEVVEQTRLDGQGSLLFRNGLDLAASTLAMDAQIIGDGHSGFTTVMNGLELDAATLTIDHRRQNAELRFDGGQEVTGTGTIRLSGDGDRLSLITLIDRVNLPEMLTFGAGIDIIGTGRVAANGSEDSLSILGGVTAEGGDLTIWRLDNDGADLEIGGGDGRIILGQSLRDVRVTGSDPAALWLDDNLRMRDVTLARDARVADDGDRFATVTVEEGLTLENSTLTIAGPATDGFSTLTFSGGQDVTGTGVLRLEGRDLFNSGTQSRIQFSSTGSFGQTFVLAQGIDVEGAGLITVNNGAELDVRGDLLADDGALVLQGEAVLSGDIRISDDGRLVRNRDMSLESDGVLTIGLAGSGEAVRAGLLSTTGDLAMGGAFAFDLAADFDAELGTEFTLIHASQTLSGSFSSVTGAAFGDGSKGLALVVRGDTVSAVVVDAALAGQQLTPADLPGGTPPVLAQTLTSEVIDAAFAGADLAYAPSYSTWRDVTVDSDVTLTNTAGYSFSNLRVSDGLTVNGRLTLDGWNSGFGGSSYMRVDGGVTIDGSGEIVLRGNTPLSSYYSYTSFDARASMQLQSLVSAAETVVLGADIALTGNGTISGTSLDRWQILGDVTATGGRLTLSEIDQGGETLSLASTSSGVIALGGAIDNGILSLAQGSRGVIRNATATDVTLAGDAAFRLDNVTATNMAITGTGQIDSGDILRLDGGLDVDGTLLVTEQGSGNAQAQFRGSQSVDGTGELRLMTSADAGGAARLSLTNTTSTGVESLTFGADLTLTGTGLIEAQGSTDHVRILGSVIGDDAGGTEGNGRGLRLSRVDQGDGALTLDARAGAITFETRLDNARLTGEGEVWFAGGLNMSGVTLDMDARILSGVTDAEGDLTVNGTLSLATSDTDISYLVLRGTQTVSGTGVIDLSAGDGPLVAQRANPNDDAETRPSLPENQLYGQSQISGAEIFVLGEDLTITGAGHVYANSSTDSMRILGTLLGSENGTLRVDDIDNAGAAMTIDASLGEVRLGRVTNTILSEAAGQTGEITFYSGADLTDVTMNIDARIGPDTSSRAIDIFGTALTLNADLTMADDGAGNTSLDFLGGASLSGTGRILMLADDVPAGQTVTNYVTFYGASTNVETFVLGSGIDVIGAGGIVVSSSTDILDLQGRVIADEGELDIEQLAAIGGRLGAAADGLLDLNDDMILTQTATLEIGIDGAGNGVVDVRDAATLDGTLALDVAGDFTAALGDTFEILRTTDGISGSFDAYSGFDLAGNLAFELVTGADTLSLRVTTDDDALAFL